MTDKKAIEVLDKLGSFMEQHDIDGRYQEEIEALNKGIQALQKNSRKKTTGFTPPTLEEVSDYIIEMQLSISAARFIDYYTANGWVVGRNKMKDWKATLRNWDRRAKENPTSTPNNPNQIINPFL